MNIKKIYSIALSLLMTTVIFLNLNTTAAFANELEEVQYQYNIHEILEIDLENFDLNQPFEISEKVVSNHGENILVTMNFEPNENVNHRGTASIGRWRVTATGTVSRLEYIFDLSRINSDWRITAVSSQAFHPNGASSSVSVGRRDSNATNPASITASGSFGLLGSRGTSQTTITRGGVMRTTSSMPF